MRYFLRLFSLLYNILGALPAISTAARPIHFVIFFLQQVVSVEQIITLKCINPVLHDQLTRLLVNYAHGSGQLFCAV